MPNKDSVPMALDEASIKAERLVHLLQTIAENFYELEDGQKFSLVEIAWDMSGEINKWMNEQEGRSNG